MLDARIAEGLQEVGGVEVDEVGIGDDELVPPRRQGVGGIEGLGITPGQHRRSLTYCPRLPVAQRSKEKPA